LHTTLETVKSIILTHKRFLLTTHVNPDGDGIGSELALSQFLRKLGKEVTIVNHSRTPENYDFLDPNHEILNFVPERHRDKILQADVIIIVDTNQPDRLRSMEPFVQQSKAIKIVIDHHLDANNFAQHYLIDEEATSTGEIVYHLLHVIDTNLFDQQIAYALYTAIMTDTGSFRYPRTDPEIHTITAHLIELGVDPTEIFSQVYEQWSPGRMRLLGKALSAMQTAYEGKLAYLVCTQEMFKETGSNEVETDNFTTYPMSIKGVVVGILINELPNGVKISFRSKGEIPINELANEFGGGGHKNAAGARLYNVKLEETVKRVIEKAGKYVSL
jgi:phosphoesterase RecJ-like protein